MMMFSQNGASRLSFRGKTYVFRDRKCELPVSILDVAALAELAAHGIVPYTRQDSLIVTTERAPEAPETQAPETEAPETEAPETEPSETESSETGQDDREAAALRALNTMTKAEVIAEAQRAHGAKLDARKTVGVLRDELRALRAGEKR